MKNRGFTLVEMMVAIAVFSIVMVVAMSALLNVIDANRKAQSIKTAINNVNFALEGISKDMRMGTDYECATELTGGFSSSDCLKPGAVAIKYSSPKGGYAYYRYKDQSIEACLEQGTVICNSNNDYSKITSPDVFITDMKFYVMGITNSKSSLGSKTQPRVVITLSGEAGDKDKIKTTFDLQTSISQRTRVVVN